jgi:hypothetical protein
MLRHAAGFVLANKGSDTRTLQAYLGHRSIQSTVRYTELAPGRFKNLWPLKPYCRRVGRHVVALLRASVGPYPTPKLDRPPHQKERGRESLENTGNPKKPFLLLFKGLTMARSHGLSVLSGSRLKPENTRKLPIVREPAAYRPPTQFASIHDRYSGRSELRPLVLREGVPAP